MSEPQHTPGSWKFSTETHFSGGAPYSESVYVTMGENTLTIGCHTGSPYRETLEANALLIAAAPDLLDALTDMINAFYPYNPHTVVTEAAMDKAVKAVLNATTQDAIIATSKTPEQ